MAGLMRDWLSKTIEQEIIEALQWRKTESHDPAICHKSAGFSSENVSKVKQETSLAQQSSQSPHSKKFTDDGSNVRILRTGIQGKYVQLLEVSYW